MLGTRFKSMRISAPNSFGHSIADRVGNIDRAGASLDRALDSAAEKIVLAP